MKLNKVKKKILIIIPVFVLIIVLLVFFGIRIFNNNSNYTKYVNFESRIKRISKSKIADTETIGWIQVQGTNIDYPVIKETESAYQSGIDYIWRNNNYVEGENREAIYGHNILNISSEPLINDSEHTRFEQLMGFVYSDFAKKNLYIQYTHDGEDEIYKIYAVSFLYVAEDRGHSYSDSNEIADYIKQAKALSLYDYDVNVKSSDHLISLITCTRYFGTMGPTQFRVDARKLRKNEKIKKYDIEISENYDIIK